MVVVISSQGRRLGGKKQPVPAAAVSLPAVERRETGHSGENLVQP
jgi:hypothetical protein